MCDKSVIIHGRVSITGIPSYWLYLDCSSQGVCIDHAFATLVQNIKNMFEILLCSCLQSHATLAVAVACNMHTWDMLLGMFMGRP